MASIANLFQAIAYFIRIINLTFLFSYGHLFHKNQAFIVNDVELSPGPKTLFFDQHVEYIANHGNDQNDYVCIQIGSIYRWNLMEFYLEF